MHYEMLLRLLLAALWGGVVGAEREYRSKSAGFRTMIMISIGSCFFTMMSILIGVGNPDRIASNIVTGIGFLGAGVIFQGDNKMLGITTAAAIWAVAAVGMGIGAGYYFAAGCASVLVVIVLALLPYVQSRIDEFHQSRTYKIQCTFAPGIADRFDQVLSASKLNHKLVSEVKEGNRLCLTWQVQGHTKDHTRFTETMMADALVERFEY